MVHEVACDDKDFDFEPLSTRQYRIEERFKEYGIHS